MHYIEQFLEMLIAEQNAASNTVQSYQNDLIRFLSASSKASVDITEADILNYLAVLHQKEYQAASRARKLSAIRQYFLFLQREKLISNNPSSGVESPKLTRPLPKIMTQLDVEKLLTAAREIPDAQRLVALLELLYATGMRVSELVSLPYSAYIQGKRDQTLIVRGKGNKERIIPVGKMAIQALDEYIALRTKAEKDNPWLFPSSSQEGHLTRQRFGQLLKQLALEAGLDPTKISPHVIRHAFATHLLHNGANLLSVQKMLGHADIATTEIYTHILSGKLIDVVNSCHPLAKVKAAP